LKFENADTASRLQKSIFLIAKSFSLRLEAGFWMENGFAG
jgi:hypothetical protein